MAKCPPSPRTEMSCVSLALLFGVLVLAALPARAGFILLEASGTISSNSSSDATIPVGTPWKFQLIYDTDAPDLAPGDPTFGNFTNAGAPPALAFFHYRAGSYEVFLSEPGDFGPNSAIVITFTSIHAIDININAPSQFPPLAGGLVSFHADFNDFSARPIFTSDALFTDPALGAGSFDATSVTLLPPVGAVESNNLTSLALTSVPEPPTSALAIAGSLSLLALASRVHRPLTRS
jgi:hypothetical protein